jgi:inner membrane protein
MFQTFTFTGNTLIYLVGIVFGSLVPDIDEPSSSIGRKTRIFSDVLKFSIGHRMFTHWLITRTLIVIFAIFIVDDEVVRLFLISLSVGMLVHDFGDHLTGGIRGYFWPVASAKKHFKLASLPVGGIVENGLIVVMSILVLIQLYLLFNKG